MNRIDRLVGMTTRLQARRYTPDFAELPTPDSTRAIGSTRTPELFGDAHTTAAANRSAIIELPVDDVDADYQRLAELLAPALVQAPTTMPWGNRSLLFRNPSGNLSNFFTPVTPAAQQRFARQAVAA